MGGGWGGEGVKEVEWKNESGCVNLCRNVEDNDVTDVRHLFDLDVLFSDGFYKSILATS